MENKEVKKLNRAFKVLMWLFIVSAGLTVYSMISALVTQEVTIFNYVMKCIDNIFGSLLIAFICSRTSVTPKNEEKTMTKAEAKLYEMIFTNGKQMLSPEIDSTIFHAMTHEDTEILGIFCTFSGMHGEELKKLLIRGYLKNVPKSEIMGNWRRILKINDKGGCVGAWMICPVCNADNGHDEYMKHCPNCGARLEKNIGNSGQEHFSC